MTIISEAIQFPLKNSNLKMFIGLCVLHLCHMGMVYLPMIHLVSFAFLGYIYATQLNIIYTTGNRYKDAPQFPTLDNAVDGIILPLVKVLAIWILAFLPWVIVAFSVEEMNSTLDWGLTILGYAYVPMGLMIIAMDDFGRALNPGVVIGGIRALGGTYLLMVFAFTAFELTTEYLDTAFTGSWIISALIGAYGIMFTGRLIGAAYREKLSDDFEEYEELNT